MGNMSYCRFENTARDLRDCRDALNELLSGESRALSIEETRAAGKLFILCCEIVGMIHEARMNEAVSIEDVIDSDKLQGEIVDEVLEMANNNAQ